MPDPISTEPPQLPKADPETLVLRGTPRRVARFRRGVIIAGATLGSATIAGITWMALQPASFVAITAERVPDLGGGLPSEALANAPRSYGDVPRLGPPLPGDLGKPVLDHRREMAKAEPGGTGGPDPAAQAAQAERQRAAAELLAARQSGILVATSGKQALTAPALGMSAAEPSQADAGVPRPDPGRDPGHQQRKLDLFAAPTGSAEVNPHRQRPPASPYMLSAGSVISASLVTGLNSDLPGIVTAQVTAPAYDSVTGRTMLIPQGTRLIGRYDSVVAFGQQRALVVWQRFVLPDGSSIQVDNWPASDTQGYAGLSDKIDQHSWQLLKGVGLATLLGVGTEIGFAGESDLVEAIRESAQQTGTRAGDQIVQRHLDVQPTLRVRPGWPLRVIVHKDLILSPWKGE